MRRRHDAVFAAQPLQHGLVIKRFAIREIKLEAGWLSVAREYPGPDERTEVFIAMARKKWGDANAKQKRDLMRLVRAYQARLTFLLISPALEQVN